MMRNYSVTRQHSFVGRQHELAEISARLTSAECRLLTLTGLGGSGKTRVAIETGQNVASQFRDGVVFVALQPLTKSDLLSSAIGQAAGLAFYGKDAPETQLLNYLHEKSLLLLLDNFEHLLDGAALVSTILEQAPKVKVLVTSREALNLQEEWLYPLTGMSTPPSIYATSLEDYEAVRLFLYHARRIQPGFDLVNEREAVIRICKLTAGLPLAIEMAASWLKGLSATQIANEIQRNLDFLATTTRNVEERHRSMRAVFDQSWKLLSENEQEAFARLSVFRGGFDDETAQAVAKASLPILGTLVEKSLLQRQSSGRYEIHELLRQYGEEMLVEKSQQTRQQHGHYFSDFVQAREVDLKGRDQIGGLDAIETDFENIRTAWDWAIETQDYPILHAMTEGLLWYGVFRSRQNDINDIYQHALDSVSGDGTAYLKARIEARQCHLLLFEMSHSAISERWEQCLSIIRQSGDEKETAICAILLGQFLTGVEQRNFVRALELIEETSPYFRRVNDRFYIAHTLHALAFAYYYQGERQRAIQYAHEAAQIRREIGDLYGTARTVLLIAAEGYSIPDYAKAEVFNREVRDIWLSLKSWSFVSFVNVNLAYLAIFRGDFEAAKNLAEEALKLATEVHISDHRAYALAMCGVIASLEEHYADGWQFLMQAQPIAAHTSSIEALEWGLPLAACGLHDYETARSANLRALQYSLRLNAPGRYCWHLPATCVLLVNEGEVERATEVLGLVFTHPAGAPAWMERWGLLTRLRANLEATLGTTAYEIAGQRGSTLDLKSVAIDMVAWLDGEQAEATDMELEEPLTPREMEVLHLMATGRTNPQIADQLVIGIGTVKTHTLNIYRKLDVTNRTQAILRAQELGILSA